jgi:hypothetical protein
MPIKHARTSAGIKANISKNIRTEIKHGRSMKVARRIAFGTAHADAKKAHLHPKWLKPMKGA